MRIVWLIFFTLTFTLACQPGIPDEYIQPSDMEDLLVDYHLARAMALRTSDQHVTQALYEEEVFKKFGVTRADFDSSLVYYYTRADRFAPICQRVAERLEEHALVLGATEGDLGKYASLNATGDTANIWRERSAVAMMPQPPYNRWEFSIDADTTFQAGDSFLLQFLSNYMYQSGSRDGMVYMAVNYQDTTISRYIKFSSTGHNQLRIPERSGKEIKGIKGYFYLDGARDLTVNLRLLFLSNIQLIRFHSIKKDEEIQKDSLPSDSITRQHMPDSVSGRDTVRRSNVLLSVEPGAGPDRVAIRPLNP